MSKKDSRPEGYQYIKIIRDHLDGDDKTIFNGKLKYPRQMEVHLPGNRLIPCNFECFYCQGKIVNQALGQWEEKGLNLIEKLKGSIPYYIYGGAYVEPLLNKYLLDYLKLTKKYGNNFGIHTNGSLLLELEEEKEFCSTLVKLADSKLDYISISLDAGSTDSHCKTKNIKDDWFSKIIEGVRLLVKLRGRKKYPVIRVCYLMNKYNSSKEEIGQIVRIMKDAAVDSLRFSVPYDLYGKKFDKVKRYRNRVEIPFGMKCEETVREYLSKSKNEKPFIFWHPPDFQDVEKMCFKQCIYSYYQITFGSDGMVYKCSSTASPSFKKMQLGKITDDIDIFNKMVIANHNPDWDAGTCFSLGGRCNRIALEINEHWNDNGMNKL
jgi:MoaA/NifB/PqqE/SkfB family radical SAM enzyme